MRLWREEREVEETVAAVKRGEANFASGRCMSLAEAEQLVTRFQRFHVGIELRSERVLEGLLRKPSAA